MEWYLILYLMKKKKRIFLLVDFYEITRSPYAPNHIGTSGMTQSPMHAIACYYIYANDTDNQKTKPREFLKQIYPKLKLFHKYLMTDKRSREIRFGHYSTSMGIWP